MLWAGIVIIGIVIVIIIIVLTCKQIESYEYTMLAGTSNTSRRLEGKQMQNKKAFELKAN